MIRRHTIGVNGRRVHYRRAGEGSAVVLLHGSPDSSSALADLIRLLSANHCVIALDTPGNGFSSPLPGAPDSRDYANALLATLDALNLGKVGIYGTHTGAGIAMDLALAHPERVSALVLDGYAIWTEAERQDLLENYLPAFKPTDDGAYLAFLWTRLVDQTQFFPWYRKTADNRLFMDRPAVDLFHRRAIDWLCAGDNYRAPYQSAFARHGEDGPERINVPTLMGCAPPDPLSNHLGRLTNPLSPSLKIANWADREHAFNDIVGFFARNHGDKAPAAIESAQIDQFEEGFETEHRLFWRGRRAGTERPLILLHDAGGSHRLFAPVLSRLAEQRPVICVDLPGHGFSTQQASPPSRLSEWLVRLQSVIDALGLQDAAIAGFHFGGQLAAGLSPLAATIGAPVYTSAEARELGYLYCPPVIPDDDGLYLLSAWRRLRKQSLSYPWYSSDAEAIMPAPAALDGDILNRRLLDLLLADRSAAAAFALQHSLAVEEWCRPDGRLDVMTLDWDPLSRPNRIHALRQHVSGAEISLPAKLADWADTLADWAR